MSKNTEHSSYREKLIEHLFVGELLKISWQHDDCELEVSYPDVDNAGYDVIKERRRIIRHIQLKASYVGGKTASQKVHIRLADKPSGCVVWLYFDEDSLELGPFLFFGGAPGKPLLSLSGAKIARHTKGDQDRFKAERPNIRVLNKGRFTRYETIQAVYEALFGKHITATTSLREV